jgi:hypothetical protein
MSECIILIIAHKELPTELEKASLKQCLKILGSHPIRLVCPKGLNITEYLKIAPNVQFEFINPKWQANYTMFNRLKVIPLLYKKFSHYKYILFYELDAWVFRDELLYWCAKNYDYIGAPWLEGWKNAKPDAPIIGIGNGGFSLRKVKSHLKALHSFSYIKKPGQLYEEFLANKNIGGFITWLKNLTISNNTYILFNDYYLHEDVFWGVIVSGNFKWYQLPSTEEALRFSIEAAPARYITSPAKLPFGCHAWPKNDPEFWKKHIHIEE